ncbi:MAG: hypothetical protein WB630_19925 [Candidatus Acidiferrales bacterium]
MMVKGLKLLGLAAVLGLSGQIVSLDHVAPRSQINDLQVTSFAIIAEAGSAEQQTTIGPGPGPSDAEIEARSLKLLENQHRNDEALEQYERVERHVDRTGGAAPKVLEDKTYRVVSTGTGTLKLLLKENDKPADPAEYHRQLLAWRDLLEIMLKPEDPKAKIAYAKSEKKKADRRELVDAAREAFLTKWAGQETRNGRVCDVFDLDPNPNFHPHSIIQDALTHVTAKIWVDREANQLSRGEAHVMRDISFGGGILGKLYRGGVFSLEQTEVAPGIWLPTRYQYDFMGRKFLFTFEEHQYIEVGQYHHDGSPKQALALVQNEIATGKSAYGDP